MLLALFREHVTSASPAQDQVFHYTLTEVPTTTLLNPEAGFRDFCIAMSIRLRACMFGCDVRTHTQRRCQASSSITLLDLLRQGTLPNPEFSHCPGHPLFLPTKFWDYREESHLSDFDVGSGTLNSSSHLWSKWLVP